MGEKEETPPTSEGQQNNEVEILEKSPPANKTNGTSEKKETVSIPMKEDTGSDSEPERSFRQEVRPRKREKGNDSSSSKEDTKGEGNGDKGAPLEPLDALRAKVTRRRAVDAAWACTECKRRKLSCDGKRPCWRCLNAGWECISIKRAPATEPCTPGHYGPGPACLTCRQHRRVCDRAKPCSRCVRLGRSSLCKYPQVWRGKVMEEKAAAKKKSGKKSREPPKANSVPTQPVSGGMPLPQAPAGVAGPPSSGPQVPHNPWGAYQMPYPVPSFAQVFGYFAPPGGRPAATIAGGPITGGPMAGGPMAAGPTRVPEGMGMHHVLSGGNMMHPLLVGPGMMQHMATPPQHMVGPGGMLPVHRPPSVPIVPFPQGTGGPERPVATYQAFRAPAPRANGGDNSKRQKKQ